MFHLIIYFRKLFIITGILMQHFYARRLLMKNKLKALAVGLLLLSGRGKADMLAGRWVQPIPGMEDQIQGFMLAKDGEAESINMATLVYEKWEHKGNQLILHGKSIGNGQTIAFDEIYVIKRLTRGELVLQAEGREEQVYMRQ